MPAGDHLARARAGAGVKRRRISLWRSFACAGAGLLHTIRTQRNARIHLVATLAAVLLASWLRLTAVEWAVLLVTIGVVWATELVNTAIESVVDRISPEQHELARIAKDAAAGAVLASAAVSLLVGIALFGPRLWALCE